jgi:hypothetical protein
MLFKEVKQKNTRKQALSGLSTTLYKIKLY